MMKKIQKGMLFVLAYLGFYPKQLWANLTRLPSYIKDKRDFKAQFSKYENWDFSLYPVLTDKHAESGKARGQYFYQDLHVANLIYKAKPVRHIDVGSRIDGFIAHLASFRKVEVLDIRPLKNDIDNVKFLQADLMQPIENLKESTDSLSCLHTIEHFGLGRYGDPIDADGHLKGLASLYQILKPGGIFYFSTQIGSPRVQFNAHRIFSVAYLLDLFKDQYRVEMFSYINDADQLHINVPLTQEQIDRNYGCQLGCGIFVLKKLENPA